MKTFKLLMISIFVISSQAFALNMVPNQPTTEELMKIIQRLSPVVFMMKDATGFFFGLCETKTGSSMSRMSKQEVDAGVFEICFAITASSQESVDALRLLYPPGRRVKAIDLPDSIPSTYFVIQKQGGGMLH